MECQLSNKIIIPKKFNDFVVFPVIHPIKLKKKHYHQAYRAPKPPKPGVRRLPEEIELEIRLMEENMEKLVLVNVE